MTTNTQRVSPLHQAKVRRRELSHYLQMDSSRYLLGVIVLLCLMSMMTLGQTGVVATKGYAISALEARRTVLLREQNQLEHRRAVAQSLTHIRQRAAQLNLRPVRPDQVRFLTVELIDPIATEPTIPPPSSDPRVSAAEEYP